MAGAPIMSVSVPGDNWVFGGRTGAAIAEM